MLIEHYNGKVSVPSQGEHGVLQIPDLLMYYNLGKFPSSTEVRRVFYNLDVSIYAKPELFPSPREVDRFLYKKIFKTFYSNYLLFPSPLEADRFLYTNSFGFRKGFRCVSVPYRGR